jgi:molecular chaperone HtpG
MTETTAPETATPSSPDTAPPASETRRFEAEVESVLRLVIDSLYSNRDVFLRELLSNASDALDKLRFSALTAPELLPEGESLEIRLVPDAAAGTLTIEDNGIGMTKDELASHLGTIAKSGTRELIKELAAQGKKDGPGLIGQFGVGFYSAFLVAERVEVTSRKAGVREAWTWSSEGRGTFSLAPAGRVQQGTSVVLHLKADAKDELRTYQLEQLVKKYSDYLHFPIQLKVDREKSDEPAWRTINRGSALWQRGASEVKKEDLDELYKHVSHDFTPPLSAKHFKIEGTTEFAGVLFVPARAPFDLFDPDAKRGLRLYVKRVFIFDEAEALLPRWLRFLRGVVDSEDLPLNVSRELLQDSRVVRIIKQQVTNKALEMLGALAKDRPEDYATFWKTFGAVLKESLAVGHAEGDHRKKVLPLLRYESSTRAGLVSLAEAKAGMKEGQPGLYFALGQSRRQLESSPHLEGLRKKGFEVLFMTDPVDHWVMGQGEGLEEFEDTKLLNVASADLDLGAKDAAENPEGDLSALRDRIRMQLQDQLSEVRLGERLVDSPACLVVPDGGISSQFERLVRAAQPELAMPSQKRILEINPKHPLVKALEAAREKDAPELPDLLTLLYEQALIAEGSPVEDPAALARRIHQLMLKATG